MSVADAAPTARKISVTGPDALEEEEDRPLLSSYGLLSGPSAREYDPHSALGHTDLEAHAKLERELLRKLDRRMSIMVVIYVLNYMDRNNASVARLRGFEEDLDLKGTEFASILSILYVGYIIMQIPSNMFLNYIGKPSIYLPACMIIWGAISVMTGLTTNFIGALLTRFFLGFVEAAFFPGALFLLSKWYKRSELGQRTALLFCGGLFSNAFGTFIASAILDRMEGTMGHAAWRWLFYTEGSITILVAISAMYILPDFPESSSTSNWLTPAEHTLARRRMVEDLSYHLSEDDLPDRKGHMAGFVLAMSDWKVWWLALALTSMVVSLSFHQFFPTLSATMGYNPTVTLLLCSPPWLFATGVAFWVSKHSDRARERFWHITVSLSIGILGFLIAMSTMNTAARYMSLFLMAQSYSGFICFLAWVSNSIDQPASKRAVALAFINSFSQLGNVTGAYVWPSMWGPTYHYSYAICISASVVTILMGFIFRNHLAALNKRRDDEGGVGRSRGYRYLL